MPDFSGPTGLALIALLLPLLGCILAALHGVSRASALAHLPVILSFAGSAGVALYLLSTLTPGESAIYHVADLGTWFHAGRLNVNFSIAVDPLSAIMLSTVTFIATFIAIFSASYMRGDSGYARYFSIMALFVFFMCLLVLANNVFVLVAGWEGVGLCSYLLVGYYYAKPSAAAAARKAFLVTRLGDVGMILGVLMLWQVGGYHTNFNELFDYIAKHPETHGQMNLVCLLLFCGAVGKSAQLPLYVWLPDAMEGPTPVSALIHAATMVTAGVYLLARCAPIFVLAPDTQLIVAVIGGLTALLAAFIALAQNDLKRVLAYSTVSQLGFMFMALGCSGAVSPKMAVFAAIFHLFTHAFFKALLFLGSGSVMHAMGNVIDMRKFGGLRKVMPITHITFLIGAAALAGLPLLSGFWSKDAILHTLRDAGESRTPNSTVYFVVFGLAILSAIMTAFYTFRAYLLTFWGPEKIPTEAHGHAHESPPMMTIPLIVLALGALAIGAVVDPITHWMPHFLDRSPQLVQAENAFHDATRLSPKEHSFDMTLAIISSCLALGGAGLAIVLYRKGGPEVVPAWLQGTHALSQNKVHVDELYDVALVKPAEGLATASRQFDTFLDAFARLISFVPRFVGAMLRPLHNGLVQFYALGMVLGLAVFITVIIIRSGR